ncbi:hypothetical protein VD0004_g238 [Verticillium dahliae]|uniref:Uncharacterized protein n=3 Tax=Verticillium TaxID=1036719 RepID=G2X3W1_VERDV|nr:uncharacterized protein VDAG_04698 [Verticillium dahliae VdLs.17]EGY23260.1 hypothetical protein VDAG_04698 [Verticillium dahliae VdLs.17]KAH6691846.1 hypothetical protein EV126DRAFT_89354 [Verticillium dahliae]PNH48333.1 hypothetical protein VD0004_g238 [Verticillium dahliae]
MSRAYLIAAVSTTALEPIPMRANHQALDHDIELSIRDSSHDTHHLEPPPNPNTPADTPWTPQTTPMSSRLPTFNGRASLERIGRCLAFGCTPDQTALAASLVSRIAKRAAPVYAVLQGYPARPGFTIPHLRVPANATWQPSATSAGLDATSWQRKADSNATYLAIANEALYQTLAHAQDTAPPDLAAKWQTLLYGAPPAEGDATAAVTIKNARTNIMPSHAITEPETIRAFTRFLPWTRDAKTTQSVVVQTLIWSLTRGTLLARTGTTLSLYEPMPSWLIGELDRLSAVENTGAETRLRKANAVLRGIGRDLRLLEEQTWNRPDAVEDMGAAKGA